jgi:hypothetical protein
MQQFDLFAARPPAISPAAWEELYDWTELRPANVERLHIQDKATCYGLTIELAQHGDAWMWSTSYNTFTGGQGYAVHEKWGNFAHDRSAALSMAVAEMERLLTRNMNGLHPWQSNWLRGLR